MKKCFFKVYNNLYVYNAYEFNFLLNKVIFSSLKKKSNNNKKKYHKTFCYETGVKRSVYNFFNLSRWNLKKLLVKANVNGLKKISW